MTISLPMKKNLTMHYSAVITSPIGKIGIEMNQETLAGISFLTDEVPLRTAVNPAAQKIIDELKQYFKDPKYTFSNTFRPKGSTFQQRVWQALQKIPRGKTLTYGELAKKIDSAPRAIGQACRTNPFPIIIPCHRIVAANHLGGYGGFASEPNSKMLTIKKWLLNHERGAECC